MSSLGRPSSRGDGVSVAVDWWLYEVAGDEASPRGGGSGPSSMEPSIR